VPTFDLEVDTSNPAALAAELANIEREMLRRQHFKDGAKWAKDKLGDVLWSKQREIFTSVSRNRRTAVPSCHEVGKSFIAADIAAWWLDRDKTGNAFVVTSAPTAKQVEAILWREIGRVHDRGHLRGRVNQKSWYMPVEGSDREELVAFGRKPDDYDPAAFQGIHAPRVLVIFDEACGIPELLWEAADSLIANDDSKILAIGNPDDPNTHFADICKPGSGWNVVPISAFDSPNLTGEEMPTHVLKQLIGRVYIEEKRRKWAPSWYWVDRDGNRCEVMDGVRCVMPEKGRVEDTNPYWQSKILGLFPVHSDAGGLIPLAWIRRAQEHTIEIKPGDPHRLGVDVGAGGDASVVAECHGPQVRILQEDHNPDTMQTCGNVIHLLEQTGAEVANVDEIGIGKGVVNRGQELDKPFVGVNVGRAAYDAQHFVNLRAELYWRLREAFEADEIDLDPLDEDTAGELCELKYKRLSSGKIQIESKDDMKRRGVPSPNRAEAIMLGKASVFIEEPWEIS
jgi:hypothetical protein